MRSMRRGTKEMDIILKGFFSTFAPTLDDPALDEYEAILGENDQDLYKWVSGQTESPPQHALMISRIKDYLIKKYG